MLLSIGVKTPTTKAAEILLNKDFRITVQVIPLAFATQITGQGGQPELNFANQGNGCTVFSGTNEFNCPDLAYAHVCRVKISTDGCRTDIPACQSQGKTIILSIGGATYTEGGFSSSDEAVSAANLIWATFGPEQSGSSANRPFGSAVLDGFDFDFESTVSNMPPFANQLRSLMDADTSKKYILTAAPQCPFPDAADDPMLSGGVKFDAVFVQFYNNYCGVQSYQAGSTTQNNFNFATWDNWAKTKSANPNVKVLLGVPANTGAAGSGYLPANQLAPVIDYCKSFSSFGGVMMWDMSQAYANSGFIASVKSTLTGASKRVMQRFTA
ncbi:MAG: hypothetical protein Q9227_003563 [Pyrenula ochraceoflavens]